MSKTRSCHALWGLAVAAAGAAASGCYSPYDNYYLPLTDPALATGGGSTGTGGSGGAPPECVPSNTSTSVADDCGKFVSSSTGKDTNPGTKDEPFATLAKAIEASGGKPIYTCTETFTEAIALKEDATFYGGLDCMKGWAYVGPDKKTDWTAPADEVPLHVITGARATLEDIAISANDATNAGGSSIALIAEAGTQLTLARCEVTAGNGANGADGAPPSGTGTPGVTGTDGTGSCVSDAGEFGGAGGQLTCDPTNVAGGDGGNGTKNMTGGDGSKGQPIGAAGTAGLGQGGAVDCMTDGKGGDGALGETGEAGLGAPMSLGALGPTGYAGVSGNEGKPGLPGQGGGGGGGGKGCANLKAGPSGGGGGSGGCGGAGGKAGSAAGASIGIVSLEAKLTLDAVKIAASNGGKGGAGAAGQPGGAGAVGGMPGAAEVGGNNATACAGGNGGNGGVGGKGGGGRGGHSIGIAHTGEVPDTTGATITTGTAGNGGVGDGDMGDGAAGVAEKIQIF